MSISEPVQFEAPRSNWIELWAGPVHFRATQNKGKFGPGHPLSVIQEYGQKDPPVPLFYRVSVDPEDGGAIVIEWLVGLPGRLPPFQTTSYYNGGPGRGLYDRLKADSEFRASYFHNNLPLDLHERAVGAYAIGVTIREWMEREFYNSVDASQCEIWARVGSKTAPFSLVPPDVFRAYKISSWGYGVFGGATAILENQPPLFSIFVAPTSIASTEKLFGIWRKDADRDFDAKADNVASIFTKAGMTQSSPHVGEMSNAAEQCVIAMLGKARALPIGSECYPVARTNALELFDELAAKVRALAIGASGREQPLNGELADRINGEGRERIMAEVEKWVLEDSISATSLYSAPQLFSVFVEDSTNQAGASAAPSLAVASSVGAENQCRDWLAREFASDPQKLRSKADFRSAALAQFSGRLTNRGFNDRVWPSLAQQHGRHTPGAKRKIVTADSNRE